VVATSGSADWGHPDNMPKAARDPQETLGARSTHVLHRERTACAARDAPQHFVRDGLYDVNVRLTPETLYVIVRFALRAKLTSEAVK
jgi:hypothetical protein